MSEYFQAHPEYFQFISLMEQESILYRKGIETITPEYHQAQRDFRKIYSTVSKSIKTSKPLRKEGAIQRPRTAIITRKYHFATSFNTAARPEEIDDNWKMSDSQNWPVRPTPSKLIYESKRMKQLLSDEYPRQKDLPIIFNTGSVNALANKEINKNNRNQMTKTNFFSTNKLKKPKTLRKNDHLK